MDNILTDTSLMEFGIKFKGVKLINVPAGYLLHIYDYSNLPLNLKKYIKDNLEILKYEINEKSKY